MTLEIPKLPMVELWRCGASVPRRRRERRRRKWRWKKSCWTDADRGKGTTLRWSPRNLLTCHLPGVTSAQSPAMEEEKKPKKDKEAKSGGKKKKGAKKPAKGDDKKEL